MPEPALSDLFDGQRVFAMRHRLREAGMVPAKAGDSFAAFLPIERGESWLMPNWTERGSRWTGTQPTYSVWTP